MGMKLINSMKWSGQADEKVSNDELKCFPFWKLFFTAKCDDLPCAGTYRVEFRGDF